MKSKPNDAWSRALEFARAGDAEGARAVVAEYRGRPESFPGAADLLTARCLVEAAPSVPGAESAIEGWSSEFTSEKSDSDNSASDECGSDECGSAALGGDSSVSDADSPESPPRAAEPHMEPHRKAHPEPRMAAPRLGEGLEGLEGLEEAVALLREVRRKNPENLHVAPILALAELRRGNHLAAAALLRERGLPTDPHLLAQFALSLEGIMRPLPETLPADWPGWPEGLDRVGREEDATEGGDSADEVGMATRPVPGPPAKPASRRGLRSALSRIQDAYFSDRPVEAVRLAYDWFDRADREPDFHLLCGLASEEVGDADRARAHLARALELDPNQLLARTFLGRAHWRRGWNDLAGDLWRSLPVEGPDDYGRHYHLALAHEAAGRRAESLVAMGVGLSDFFMETREFHIERAYKRWLRATDGSAAEGGGPDAPAAAA